MPGATSPKLGRCSERSTSPPCTGPAYVIIHDLRLFLDRPRASVDEFGLTRRERDVLARVRAGDTNTQIARALGISPATVRTHLERTYAKLGVSTRTAALARVHET